MELKGKIEALFAKTEFSADDRAVYEEFKLALRRGEVRSAEKDADGNWHANTWVKQGILLGFRMGAMVEISSKKRITSKVANTDVEITDGKIALGVGSFVGTFDSSSFACGNTTIKKSEATLKGSIRLG